jgi:DNA adenine methylase
VERIVKKSSSCSPLGSPPLQGAPILAPPLEPFLKWAGGKRQLLAEIRSHLPARFGKYFEPFVGGAALFFSTSPNNAVLGDTNERLVRTYRGVRDSVEQVISALSEYPNDRAFFLTQRARDVDSASDVEMAAWFIYLNRTGYNGLYRVNRSGQFNVPFGRYLRPTICNSDRLRSCSRALRNTDLRIGDFEDITSQAKAGDFVYFDPPYVPVAQYSDFARYTARGFSLADHRRLCDVASRLKSRGVAVLISNSEAPVVRELYQSGFQIRSVMATRSINSRGERRGRVLEVLIS